LDKKVIDSSPPYYTLTCRIS